MEFRAIRSDLDGRGGGLLVAAEEFAELLDAAGDGPGFEVENVARGTPQSAAAESEGGCRRRGGGGATERAGEAGEGAGEEPGRA